MAEREVIKEYVASVKFETEGSKELKPKLDKAEKEVNKSLSSLKKIFDAFMKGFESNPKIQEFIKKAIKGAEALGAQVAKMVLNLVGLIEVAVAAVVLAITAATAIFMDKMAAADLQTQKFALSLFTTVKNARSLQTVMDAMGVKNIDDLKYVNLIPEQRAQFMALRKLASNLGPDDAGEKGMQNIRAVGYEFQKLFLVWNYFLTYLAATLGQVLAGPLKIITAILEKIVGFSAKHMKGFAQDIGRIVDVFSQLLEIAMKLMYILKPLFDGVGFILAPIVSALRLFMDIFLLFLHKVNQFIPKPGSAADSTKITLNPAGAGVSLGQKIAEKLFNASNNNSHTDTLSRLEAFAKDYGLRITSRAGGKHNTGSLHYLHRAIDVDNRGVNYAKLKAAAASMGFRVLDERIHPKGQKEWDHAHYHIDDALSGLPIHSRLPGIQQSITNNHRNSATTASANIQIHVHGAKEPVAVAQAVSEKLKTAMQIRNTTTSYA